MGFKRFFVIPVILPFGFNLEVIVLHNKKGARNYSCAPCKRKGVLNQNYILKDNPKETE